jgi:hypothetical protein
MADAIPSWKAYVSATASGGGAHYGKECARLRQYGMAELVETHFLEAAQVPHIPHDTPPTQPRSKLNSTSPL